MFLIDLEFGATPSGVSMMVMMSTAAAAAATCLGLVFGLVGFIRSGCG